MLTERKACVHLGAAYTEKHSGDSSKSAKLSNDVPRVASLRLAAADILEASGPPFGCLRLRSCTKEVTSLRLEPFALNAHNRAKHWAQVHLYAAKDFVSKTGRVFVAPKPHVGVRSQSCTCRLGEH